MLLLVIALTVNAGEVAVSPVEKVVSLVNDLKTEVETEGAAEAATYDKFACFCKTKTNEKVGKIDDRVSEIDQLSGAKEDYTATRDQTKANLKKLNNELSELQKELADATAVREAEKAQYQEEHTDTSNALAGVDQALSAVGGAQSLVERKAAITSGLAMADALGVKGISLLQSPSLDVPGADYKSHGGDLLKVFDDLKTTFSEKKASLESEEDAKATAYNGVKQTKSDQITATKGSIDTAESLLADTETNLATTEEDLAEEKALLSDDRTYLKDLTGQCEAKAREWDQRSSLRKEELAALTEAFNILSTTVSAKAAATGAGGRHAVAEVRFVQVGDEYADVVFVQEAEVHRHGSSEARNKAITMLKLAGEKTQNADLSLLAMRLAADPFAKVKDLIQKLIERLVSESQAEATQKGWCDEQQGKAKNERDFRHSDAQELTAQIQVFEARRQKYEDRSADLSSEISALEGALTTATNTRSDEKAQNKQTLENAQEGLKALKNAIGLLRAFYKKGSKASVALVQASPVDQDLPSSHQGAYQGKQAEAGGILGMLETIQSDFDRSIKETTEEEEEQHRNFVKFSTETKASVASKETGRTNTEAELLQTRGDLAAALENLQRTQTMLDGALETLSKLYDACVDTGMTYEQKAQRRQDEIDALKNALGVLSEEDGTKLFLQK